MKLDAILFRKILMGLIALLVIGTGASFYFLSGVLKTKGTELNHARIDAELGSSSTANLQKLQSELDKYKDVIPKAKEIVASAADFKYQDQVIRDINTLARSSNITITSYNFADGSGGAANNAAPTAPAPASPAAPTLGAAQARKITVTISMKSPVPYDDYLRFLRRMERNITRLQVTGVNLSPDPTVPTSVINPSVGIEIFVKG